ncbi:MAG: hypothetical protein ACRDPR_10065, partial [Nocardioidaceae bacterium]
SHLDLASPGKTFAAVAAALGGELDVATSAVGGIRRNHRLTEVDNVWDLIALVALHDLGADHFVVLERRLSALAGSGRALLLDPANADLAGETRDRLMDLVGVGEAFAPNDGEPDETPANQRLGTALAKAASHDSQMALRRAQAAGTIGIHRVGNATVPAMLEATASMLGLEVLELLHHPDRYLHFARCVDRVRLVEPAPPGAGNEARPIEPVPDVVALEENPFRPADVAPAPRPHGQLFAITRAGWEDVPVTVRVVGIGERCWYPMVVNVDTGAGVVYTGPVPEGSEVRFETTGVVTQGLVGEPSPTPVTRNAFSFSGAVFASSPAHSNDFVWADGSDPAVGGGRAATFVETAPVDDAFDPASVFPHAGGLVDAPTLLVNTTRWAFFVRAAHFGRRTDEGEEPAVPIHLA